MSQVLASLADYEYVMQALTLLGVLYVVYKMSGVQFRSPVEGIGASALGFDALATQGYARTNVPGARSSKEGFSMSGNEAPSFNSVAFDETQLNQLEQVGQVVVDGAYTEGLRSGGRHSQYVQGMKGGLGNLGGALQGM